MSVLELMLMMLNKDIITLITQIEKFRIEYSFLVFEIIAVLHTALTNARRLLFSVKMSYNLLGVLREFLDPK